MYSPTSFSKARLKRLEKFGYGAGDMAVNVAYSSMMLLITYFYTDVYGLKPQDMGIMFAIVRIVDSLLTPIMGYITDNYTTRWGRYRHYFLALSVPFGLSIFLTFSTPDLDYAGKLVWAYVSYIFVTLMFTAVTIPYISVLSVMTTDKEQRLSASGYRLFMAKLAAFGVTIIVPVLATSDIWQGNTQLGFQAAMGMMSLLAIILLIFCFANVRERIVYPNVKLGFKKQIHYVLNNKLLMLLCLSCLLSTIGFMVRGAMAMYYAEYYLGGGAKLQSWFLGVNVTGSILAMIASTWLTKRICKIKLFYRSQIIAGAFSVLMYFLIAPDSIILAFILFFILSFVVDLHAPVFWSAIADAVDYGEEKDGVRVPGMAFCAVSFCQKISIGLSGIIVGILLVILDYVPQQNASVYTMQGIAFAFTIIPGVFHILVGCIMRHYRVTDRQFKQVKIANIDMQKTLSMRVAVK
ncbi:MFS transporter [Catenovulum sediminis]|uniref:Glycoside-pentoside-hexuronide (GPH):cation symporter n=1 Tax=Catenovulum sediminis TaxID=1740262 RepID=A0ABV1RC28_9ALTE|nr:glycoside-pentoside-hexuronide (GPH):cation symporter [Catenovulum sediminis]